MAAGKLGVDVESLLVRELQAYLRTPPPIPRPLRVGGTYLVPQACLLQRLHCTLALSTHLYLAKAVWRVHLRVVHECR